MLAAGLCVCLGACALSAPAAPADAPAEAPAAIADEAAAEREAPAEVEAEPAAEGEADSESAVVREPVGALGGDGLGISYDFRDSFAHGDKPSSCQKYIVLHDTEGDSSASSVVDWWDSNGAGVAAHFVVDKDGSVVQCVPVDKIAHHAGFGDTGHNAFYGVEDESRDDKVGTAPIGDWARDYGMNSWSIGIELVHVGGSGDYPEPQLAALDALIAALDGAYGFEAPIIDHKAWRTGNSDTSAEFAGHLSNYQTTRHH